MRRSAYNNSNWLTPNDFRDLVWGETAAYSAVPIGLANYQFNIIDTNAIENGLIQMIDSVFYYVPNRPVSPYKLIHTFVASPLADSVPANVNFRFSNLFQVNKSAKTLTSLVVDFGDGNGNRSVNLAGMLSVSYSSNGYKYLKFLASFNDGTSVTTYALVKVVNFILRPPIIMNGQQAQTTDETLYAQTACIREKEAFYMNSELTFQGYDESIATKGMGEVKIFYATNGTCDGVLRKPIIVLDGFDPGDTSVLSLIN